MVVKVIQPTSVVPNPVSDQRVNPHRHKCCKEDIGLKLSSFSKRTTNNRGSSQSEYISNKVNNVFFLWCVYQEKLLY